MRVMGSFGESNSNMRHWRLTSNVAFFRTMYAGTSHLIVSRSRLSGYEYKNTILG
jgi:hypothetical protein